MYCGTQRDPRSRENIIIREERFLSLLLHLFSYHKGSRVSLPLRDLRVYPTPSHRRLIGLLQRQNGTWGSSRPTDFQWAVRLARCPQYGGLWVFHSSSTHILIMEVLQKQHLCLPTCSDKAIGLCGRLYPPAGCILLQGLLQGQFKWLQSQHTKQGHRDGNLLTFCKGKQESTILGDCSGTRMKL